MCTVVVRWSPDRPALVLGLRDELVDRPFDDPGHWWPEQPTVLGGRDRLAGGTWCATDVATGVTALVLNRPQRPEAEAGAASRGVLPLLAVRHGAAWPEHARTAGMASFALVLVTDDAPVLWQFDGDQLIRTELGAGTHMVTAGAGEQGRAERHLPAFEAAGTAAQWQDLVSAATAGDDPASLLVRLERDGRTYATVFAQVIEAEPGHVVLRYARTPSTTSDWVRRDWSA